MLGVPAQFEQGNGQVEYERANYFGFYFQDSWKIGPRLSVNGGLRWEPFLPIHHKLGMVSHFEESWFVAGRKSTVFPNAPAGILFRGDEGFPGDSNTFGHLKQFAPRLGLVIDRRGDGRETVRTSYGIFYDYPIMWHNSHFPLNPPFGQDIQINNPPGGFENPWQGYPGGNPFPTPLPLPKNIAFPQFGSFVNLPLHARPMYMQQWNLTYQKQLSLNWLLSVSYLGNKTTHLWLGRDSNHAVYVPGNSTTGNTNLRRRLYLINPVEGQYYADILQTDDGANANYNGLLIGIQKRFSKGLSWNSNYTFSHCLNDGEVGIDITNIYPDPDNRRTNRGPCAADRRHILNTTILASTPKIGSGATEVLTRDWQVSTAITVQTGSALTVTSGPDNALTGIAGQRPIQVGDPKLQEPTLDRWFNTAAYIPNPPGLWGGIGRGTLVGPSSWNVNAAISRRFLVGEASRVEFRAEAFNALNVFRKGNPNTTLNSSDFGRIRSALDPRIVQFALKYVF
jgi:hypothetical protein